MSRVVVGFDGSGSGADAIAFGCRWAQASGDLLVVATVHAGATPVAVQRVDPEWAAYEREQADQVLARARALVEAQGAFDVEYRRVDAGSAAHGLHELAEHDGTPLVVLGAHRTGEHARTFPGSTADRLFSGSSGPVAIVPRGYAATPGSVRRVTAAYIDTPDGRVALVHAARIAAHLDGELRVVSVVPDTRVTPALGEPARFGDGQRADYDSALREAVAGVDPSVPRSGVLLEGAVADTLSDIGPEDADVVVAGSRGYGPVRRVLLGGVSSRLVRHARVPVIVVPRGD